MKISREILNRMLVATLLSNAASATTGTAIAADSKLADAQFEVNAGAKDVVISNKTDLKDVRQTTAMKLAGLADTARIVLHKGAKLGFRGNCKFQISAGNSLVLDPESYVFLKSGASIELTEPCVVPAKQFFILDPGKVLRSVKGAPVIYASHGDEPPAPASAPVKIACPGCGRG